MDEAIAAQPWMTERELHRYFATMENTVFPELRAAAEILKTNKIWLQDDNASPHKAARAK